MSAQTFNDGFRSRRNDAFRPPPARGVGAPGGEAKNQGDGAEAKGDGATFLQQHAIVKIDLRQEGRQRLGKDRSIDLEKLGE
jgi:hypothetical protein